MSLDITPLQVIHWFNVSSKKGMKIHFKNGKSLFILSYLI